MSDSRDAGYDDFLDAVEDGEPYYLEGTEGGYLPPRLLDPATGEQDLTEQPLPDTGELLTYTQTHVAAPQFAEDAPFVVAIAEFGPVRLTGQVRELEPSETEIGQEVTLDIEHSETNDERLVVFRPA